MIYIHIYTHVHTNVEVCIYTGNRVNYMQKKKKKSGSDIAQKLGKKMLFSPTTS